MDTVRRVLVTMVLSACTPAPPPAPTPVVITSVAETPPKTQPEPRTEQSSPRHAIQAFLRAYDEKNWNLLLEFVPESERSDLTSEKLQAAWEGSQAELISRKMQAIRSVVDDAPIDVTGTHASMAFGAGEMLRLVKEDQSWKIADF